ncbi:glycosyltransferase family 39 protein [Flavobacterium piscinae]|uniref:glycosyltransferase family 39 protein n=1 Tax=Flavobacterium piscinae TaxID=2506424 RepID=UPI00199EFEE3|nr:glycosyltransferase family 39 protein [Flavobacterium piscinae]MBC8883667.1 glycosyltransferase family 39 protein [Flavobacterium piscinae]
MNDANPKLTFKEFYDGILFWEYIPHMYFYLVRILFELFGYTTLVARVFSAIIGVLGVYSMYLLAKEIFNKKVGLVAADFSISKYFSYFVLTRD